MQRLWSPPTVHSSPNKSSTLHFTRSPICMVLSLTFCFPISVSPNQAGATPHHEHCASAKIYSLKWQLLRFLGLGPSPLGRQGHRLSSRRTDIPLLLGLGFFCCWPRFGLSFAPLCRPPCLRSSTDVRTTLRTELPPPPFRRSCCRAQFRSTLRLRHPLPPLPPPIPRLHRFFRGDRSRDFGPKNLIEFFFQGVNVLFEVGCFPEMFWS